MYQALRQKSSLFMRYISEKCFFFQRRQLWEGHLIFFKSSSPPFSEPQSWRTLLRVHQLLNISSCLPVQAWCAMGQLSEVHPHLSASDYSKIFQLTPSWFLDAVIFYMFQHLKERRVLKPSFFIFKFIKFLAVLNTTGFSCWF